MTNLLQAIREHNRRTRTGKRIQPGGGTNWRAFEQVATMAIARHVELLPIPRIGARYVRNKGLVRVKAPCDICGTVRGTGQSFITDAKSCADPVSFNLKSNIETHQIDQLVSQGKAGAISGVMIDAVAAGKTYWLPWRLLTTAEKSFHWNDPRLTCLGIRSVMPDLFRVIGKPWPEGGKR